MFRSLRRRWVSSAGKLQRRRRLALEPLEHRMLLSAASLINTVAGNGTAGYIGDGAAATAEELYGPTAVAVDSAGDIFIADQANNRVREVTAGGTISTVAGNGTAGYSGDTGKATSAELDLPLGVAVDSSSHLFIADYGNNCVREVNLLTGVITTVAGDGTAGFTGDGSAATSAELNGPTAVAQDSAGDLFIADTNNSRVREVQFPTNGGAGIITTVAGNGTAGFSGDGAAATAAELYWPQGLAVDQAGNLFIADTNNNRVREVGASSHTITTVVGSGTQGYAGDGAAATAAELDGPTGLAIDGEGHLYIADSSNNRIRVVYLTAGTIAPLAGNGTAGFSGDEGAASSAELNGPKGIAVDSSGDLFLADTGNNRVREITDASLALPVSTAVGLYNPTSSTFYLTDSLTTGVAQYTFGYGAAGGGWTPLVGDWNGSGNTGVGLYNPKTSTFYLTESLTTGVAQYTFGFGAAGGGWIPLVGDWNGKGADGVGLYNPATSTFYLTNSFTTGVAQYTFGYGAAGGGWTPLVGDWNGNGADGVGLYNPATSTFYLTNAFTTGVAQHTFGYGVPNGGWTPLVGDWNGKGADGVGLYAPASSTFYLTNAFTTGVAQYTFGYGAPNGGWTPLVGDWNGSGKTGVGLYAPQTSTFYLTTAFTTGVAQYTFGYGAPDGGWTPLIGHWSQTTTAQVSSTGGSSSGTEQSVNAATPVSTTLLNSSAVDLLLAAPDDLIAPADLPADA